MLKDLAMAIGKALELAGTKVVSLDGDAGCVSGSVDAYSSWDTIYRVLLANEAGDLALPADDQEVKRIANADLSVWMDKI